MLSILIFISGLISGLLFCLITYRILTLRFLKSVSNRYPDKTIKELYDSLCLAFNNKE
jgi:hypothetical protein